VIMVRIQDLDGWSECLYGKLTRLAVRSKGPGCIYLDARSLSGMLENVPAAGMFTFKPASFETSPGVVT
jgi:hypothetical protein